MAYDKGDLRSTLPSNAATPPTPEQFSGSEHVPVPRLRAGGQDRRRRDLVRPRPELRHRLLRPRRHGHLRPQRTARRVRGAARRRRADRDRPGARGRGLRVRPDDDRRAARRQHGHRHRPGPGAAAAHHAVRRHRRRSPRTPPHTHEPHENIPPFQPWPEPVGGYRVRTYDLTVPALPNPPVPALPLHHLHGELHRPEAGATRPVEAVAAQARRLRTVLDRAGGRVRPPHPLAVDDEQGQLARGRAPSGSSRRRSP